MFNNNFNFNQYNQLCLLSKSSPKSPDKKSSTPSSTPPPPNSPTPSPNKKGSKLAHPTAPTSPTTTIHNPKPSSGEMLASAKLIAGSSLKKVMDPPPGCTTPKKWEENSQ